MGVLVIHEGDLKFAASLDLKEGDHPALGPLGPHLKPQGTQKSGQKGPTIDPNGPAKNKFLQVGLGHRGIPSNGIARRTSE
jgi:hypothetical protein